MGAVGFVAWLMLKLKWTLFSAAAAAAQNYANFFVALRVNKQFLTYIIMPNAVPQNL